MSILSCQPSTRRRGAATRSKTAMVVAGLSILATTMWTARSEAHCSAAALSWAQRCSGALPPPKPAFQATRLERIETKANKCNIPLPVLDFKAVKTATNDWWGLRSCEL